MSQLQRKAMARFRKANERFERKRISVPGKSMSFLYTDKKAASAFLLLFESESISPWKLFNKGATSLRTSWNERKNREVAMKLNQFL